MKIVLKLHGLGHVPSMKNNKMLTRGRLITDPEKQKWMDRAIRSLEFQLRSLFQTEGAGMPTMPSQQSWTVWSAQFDDSTEWIEHEEISVQRVAKGLEGAIITLETI